MKEREEQPKKLSSLAALEQVVKKARGNLTWEEAEELMSLVRENKVLRLHPEAHPILTNVLYLLTDLFGNTFPKAILQEAEISEEEKGEQLKETLLFAEEFAANRNNSSSASAMLIFSLLPWCFHQPTQRLLLKTLLEEERIKLEEELQEKIEKGVMRPLTSKREVYQRLVGELEWGPKAIIEKLYSHSEEEIRELAVKAFSLITYFEKRQPLYHREAKYIVDLDKFENSCLQVIIPPAPRPGLLSSLSPLSSAVPSHPEEELFLIQDRHLPLYLCLSGISFKFADK